MNGVTIEKNEYRDKDGRWYTSSEKVPFTGSQSTVLAAKLSPPPKPIILSEPKSHIGCGVITLVVSIVLIIADVGFIKGGFFGIIGFIGILISILIFVIILSIYPNENKKYKENQEQLKTDLPQWEAAMNRWNKQYYCFRDDIVFIPGETKK